MSQVRSGTLDWEPSPNQLANRLICWRPGFRGGRTTRFGRAAGRACTASERTHCPAMYAAAVPPARRDARGGGAGRVASRGAIWENMSFQYFRASMPSVELKVALRLSAETI